MMTRAFRAAATILPSFWSRTALRVAKPAIDVRTRPPVPNVWSSVPSGFKRTSANLYWGAQVLSAS